MNKEFALKYSNEIDEYDAIYPTLDEAKDAKEELQEQGYEVSEIEVLFRD